MKNGNRIEQMQKLKTNKTEKEQSKTKKIDANKRNKEK